MSSLRRDVRALIHRVWPSLAQNTAISDSYGFLWDSISTPFTHYENGKMAAHVGTFKIPIYLQNQLHPVATLHAVCTHPDFRGRGFASSKLKEAISFLENQSSAISLFTEIPEFYTQFGFRSVQTSYFWKDIQPISPLSGFRQLSADSHSDLLLFRAAFKSRLPVSEVYCPMDDGSLLAMNELLSLGKFKNIFYAEDLDLVAAYEIEGQTLKLYDIIAKRIPKLTEIVARMSVPISKVILYFTPDRLSENYLTEFTVKPADGLHFMVRGKFPPENQPFGLSPVWQS